MAARPELQVDDHAVEDIGLGVGQDVLDGADLPTVGGLHRGAVGECDLGAWFPEIHGE